MFIYKGKRDRRNNGVEIVVESMNNRWKKVLEAMGSSGIRMQSGKEQRRTDSVVISGCARTGSCGDSGPVAPIFSEKKGLTSGDNTEENGSYSEWSWKGAE